MIVRSDRRREPPSLVTHLAPEPSLANLTHRPGTERNSRVLGRPRSEHESQSLNPTGPESARMDAHRDRNGRRPGPDAALGWARLIGRSTPGEMNPSAWGLKGLPAKSSTPPEMIRNLLKPGWILTFGGNWSVTV